MEHKALRHFEASLPTGGAAVYHVDLGAELEIPSTNLSVTMKRHCQVGFPLQGAKIGKHYHYKFNTQFFRIVSR